MKYLRLYNFIAEAIRILAIQEEEVYKKYKALSVSKKKEINQKLAGLFPELYDKNLRYSEIKEDILSDDLMYRLGEFKEVCESKKEYFELIQLLENLVNILRWRSHPIFWNRAMESVIESQSSDGGSHDLCRGSQ